MLQFFYFLSNHSTDTNQINVPTGLLLLRPDHNLNHNITSYRCIYLNVRVYSSFELHVRLDCCVP